MQSVEQLELFNFKPQSNENFTPDDWETPDPLAQFVASLVTSRDRRILCPGAGRGQIEKFLPNDGRLIHAVEIKRNRYLEGRAIAPQAQWFNDNFITLDPYHRFDVIPCNPPFSLAMNFIDRGLRWLDPENPESRLLFILPLDHFCSQERGEMMSYLNCHFHDVMPIVGRVGFIREGRVENGSQRYHAIFDIRPGLKPSQFNLIWI